MSHHPYLGAAPKPLAFAHRGGALRYPENTLHAFREAYRLGCTHIETDLHYTRDGVIVCFHDATLERTTNGSGRVDELTFEELRRLDAAYHFSTDGGVTYPERGRGHLIPTLEEALDAVPGACFNLEIKDRQEAMIPDLLAFIEAKRLYARVLVASAETHIVMRFREKAGRRIVTSAGALEALWFWAAVRLRLHRHLRLPYQALQVPAWHRKIVMVDRRFVEAAHEHGVDVHVWTVNERAEMARLIGLGVDAIMSDAPELLLEVLGRPPR